MLKIPLPQLPGPARLLMAVFGLVFGGAGLCFLGLIWSDESDFVPVFARIFVSLVALAFLAFGGTMAVTAIRGTSGAVNLPDLPLAADAGTSTTSQPATYTCPHCGGGLQQTAEVSPLGDTKCPFCGRWFNIHGRT
jgi:hypothetical protein